MYFFFSILFQKIFDDSSLHSTNYVFNFSASIYLFLTFYFLYFLVNFFPSTDFIFSSLLFFYLSSSFNLSLTHKLIICVSICVSVCLSVSPSIYLSLSLSLCVSQSVSLSVCLFVCLSLHLPLCLSVCLYFSLSMYLYILSVSLSLSSSLTCGHFERYARASCGTLTREHTHLS